MNKSLIGASALLALGLSCNVLAQNNAPPPPPPSATSGQPMRPHEGMKMPSPEERFKELDTNKDGSLSLEEFRTGMERRHEEMRKHMQEMHEHMRHGEHEGADAHEGKMPMDHAARDKSAPAE